MNNTFFNTIQQYLINLKKTISDILNYFLADAAMQNILVGSVVAFQMTSFVVKQVKAQVKGLI